MFTVSARVWSLAAVIAAAGTAFPALAQSPTDSDALRGPKVSQPAAPKSLVKRDMSGKFEPLDTRPEQAALDLLGLKPEERTAADKVITERYQKVTKLLHDNWDLFLKIQTSRQGGAKPEELRPLIKEFRPIAAPLLSPTLEDQVAAALPEAKRSQFKSLVDEYKTALLAEDRGGMGAGAGTGGGGGKGRGREAASPDDAGKPADAATGGFPPRLEFNMLLREMARSLKGIVDERKEHMEALLKAIDATPEQEAKIREIVRGAAESSRKNGALGEPSYEQRAETWRKIMDVLTPEQRQKAIEARRAGA